jgi:ferritin
MYLNTPYWITTCLHYSEPWEDLIAKAVKPFVDVVLQTGIADNFYFTRSKESSPHLRLNFKGNPEVFENVLKPNLEEHFQQYFISKPSKEENAVQQNRNVDFSSVNYIQHTRYEPLIQRLGSQLGWEISETAFSAASRIANHLIREKSSTWTYNEMMSAAMKLHLSMVYASGLDLNDAAIFFRALFRDWETHFINQNSNHSFESAEAPHLSFRRVLKAHHDGISSHIAALWETFRHWEHTESVEFISWFKSVNEVSLELDMALEIGKLSPIPDSSGIHFNESEKPGHEKWTFLAEYGYFLNNNLGIQNKHEGYLFFLLDHSLKTITQNTMKLKMAG